MPRAATRAITRAVAARSASHRSPAAAAAHRAPSAAGGSTTDRAALEAGNGAATAALVLNPSTCSARFWRRGC